MGCGGSVPVAEEPVETQPAGDDAHSGPARQSCNTALDVIDAGASAVGTMQIAATGRWRDEPSRFEALKQELKLPIKLLQQGDEAEMAAQCAHGIMQTQALVSDGLTLFVEAGRGSTQFVVLDSQGTVVHRAYADGFPKKGDVPYEQKKLAASQVHAAYGGQIQLVVAFGSLWYILEENGSPVVADKGPLPSQVDNYGRDFQMEFLTAEFAETKMLCIRNVTVPTGELRKITWGGSYTVPFIDLGSGKAAVVDPKSGTQSLNNDLPEDIPAVAALLREMIKLSCSG